MRILHASEKLRLNHGIVTSIMHKRMLMPNSIRIVTRGAYALVQIRILIRVLIIVGVIVVGI